MSASVLVNVAFGLLALAAVLWAIHSHTRGLERERDRLAAELRRARWELTRAVAAHEAARCAWDEERRDLYEARLLEARAYVDEVARLRGGRPVGVKVDREEHREDAAPSHAPKPRDVLLRENLDRRLAARVRVSNAQRIPLGDLEELIRRRLYPHPKQTPGAGETDPPLPPNWQQLIHPANSSPPKAVA